MCSKGQSCRRCTMQHDVRRLHISCPAGLMWQLIRVERSCRNRTGKQFPFIINPASPGAGRNPVSKPYPNPQSRAVQAMGLHCPWHKTGTDAYLSPCCPEVRNVGLLLRHGT